MTKKHKVAQFALPIYAQASEPFQLIADTAPDPDKLAAEQTARSAAQQQTARLQTNFLDEPVFNAK